MKANTPSVLFIQSDLLFDKQRYMFHDLKSEIKLFLIVAVASVLIAVAGILLLRESSPTPSVSEGKALVYGKAVALSDVQSIPGGPLVEGIIGAIPEDHLTSFAKEARQPNTAHISQATIYSYFVNFSLLDEQGEFQFELDPGLYVLCYFSPTTPSEAMRLEACARANLERGERLTIKVEKMFGTSITGKGIETVPLTDIFPLEHDSFNASADTSTWQTYRNDEFGFEVRYPNDWEVKGQVVATGFTASAECQSLETIDFQPPSGAGSSSVLHSFVQVCTKQVTDGSTLDEFMQQEYGDRLESLFDTTEINGMLAYRSRGDRPADATLFLQSGNYRMQLTSAVVADSEHQEERGSQVNEILSTFRFVDPATQIQWNWELLGCGGQTPCSYRVSSSEWPNSYVCAGKYNPLSGQGEITPTTSTDPRTTVDFTCSKE